MLGNELRPSGIPGNDFHLIFDAYFFLLKLYLNELIFLLVFFFLKLIIFYRFDGKFKGRCGWDDAGNGRRGRSGLPAQEIQESGGHFRECAGAGGATSGPAPARPVPRTSATTAASSDATSSPTPAGASGAPGTASTAPPPPHPSAQTHQHPSSAQGGQERRCGWPSSPE